MCVWMDGWMVMQTLSQQERFFFFPFFFSNLVRSGVGLLWAAYFDCVVD